MLEEKPFGDRIDYDQPVNLVAIAPSFHRDNLTDRKYHHLKFEFFQFSIVKEDNKFYLVLKDIDSEKTSQLQIFCEDARESDLPSPPQRLLKFIADFPPRLFQCFSVQIYGFWEYTRNRGDLACDPDYKKG